MNQSSAPNKPCALCKTTAMMQDSHIIPRWTYKRIIKGNPAGTPASPVRIADGSAMAYPKQAKEYLLCRDCEELFSDWEDYISIIAVQSDNSFPALDQLLNFTSLAGTNDQVGDASNLNTEKIALFAASVLWRASVSETFSEVNFGDKYNKLYQNYLLGKSQFPEQSCLVLEFVNPKSGPRVDRYVVHPESQKKDGAYHCHQFFLFGMWFRLFIGGRIPPSFNSISFVHEKLVRITDGGRLLHSVSQKVSVATPKGRLASR